MFLDEIPDVIRNLSDMEQRLLSRIVPFIKIIKLGGRFGQSGFRGQAVLFAQDIEEISEQLPLPITRIEQVINKTELIEIAGNRAIIRGSIHQGHDMFSDATRGKQCTAIAAVAIAMSLLHNLQTWTKNLIDTILLIGDALYVTSISKRKNPHLAEINRDFLSVDELHTDIEIFGNVINLFITQDSSISGHLYNDNTKILGRIEDTLKLHDKMKKHEGKEKNEQHYMYWQHYCAALMCLLLAAVLRLICEDR
ncbi:uncharacterized protein LOC115240773 [Formica exsecta]|uniref:uncharacterized protein LOC115240773 n=1 Tax=Formica exsecta TaxID=72781 RepID=UPI0011431276|nr:uncharacterized protein LOC115240773 [Formica exsecta]